MCLCMEDPRSGLAQRCSAAINGARSARSSYFLYASGGVVERLIRLFVFDYCTSWKMSTLCQRMPWERGRYNGRYKLALIEAGIVQDLNQLAPPHFQPSLRCRIVLSRYVKPRSLCISVDASSARAW